MEALYDVLKEIGIEVENKVKEELSGPSGKLKALFYNIITPLVINVQTERDGYHFIFHKSGAVSLHRGLHDHQDVKVSGEPAELRYLLQARDKERFEMYKRARKIEILASTFKGRQAVTKLRKLFL